MKRFDDLRHRRDFVLEIKNEISLLKSYLHSLDVQDQRTRYLIS